MSGYINAIKLKDNPVGRPINEGLTKKTIEIPKEITVKRRYRTEKETQQVVKKFNYIIDELRQNHRMTAIAKALGISKVHLYSLIHEPYKASDELLEKLEELYKNQILITPNKTLNERLEEENKKLKKQLIDLQAKYEKEIEELRNTVNNLNFLVNQMKNH